MYKFFLHIPLLFSILFSFSGCKGKRVVQKTQDQQVDLSQTASALEIQFAAKYIDACSMRMKGNVSDALKLFNECLKLNPNNVAVKYELAYVNKILGINDVALVYAKQCAAADPKNEWYQLLLVECYRALKQYQNSVKVQEQLVRSNPNNSEFKENLAIGYTYVGQYEKAYTLYNDLEKQYGINEQITINKIKLLQQENKPAEIEKEINKLIQSAPDNSRYLTYLAEHYEYMKQPEKAKAIYDKILIVDPDNATVHLALSDYYKLKGDENTSFNELKLAFLNAELDVFTKFNIAQVFYSTFKKFPESNYGAQGFELAQIMLKVHPSSPEANSLYGDYLFLDKNYEEASRYFYVAALKDKSDYKTWEKLLNCELKVNKFDSLEKHSYEALELFPNQPNVYYLNGVANINLRNYKKASESFRDGLEYVIDDKPLMSGFYSYLGDAYNYLKEYEKSDKAFEDALKINADNVYVLNAYAYYLSLRKDQLEKAEKFSKRSLELNPNEGNYMDTYGLILFQLQKYTLAEEWLRKAVEYKPKNPNVLEHYADCMLMLQNTSEAVKFWQLAIDAGGNKERLQKKIQEKN